MGLDIHTRRKSPKGYFRMNWTNCGNFVKWCESNKLPHPFPGWNGSNDGLDLEKSSLRDWLHQFEIYEKNNIKYDWMRFSLMTPASAMRKLAFELVDKENEVDWDYITAINWYFFAKENLNNGFIMS